MSSGIDRTVRQDLGDADYLALPGIVIAMFFDDHGPPHFQARRADQSAKIRIDTLEPIDSTLERRQLRIALAWAELHQEERLENWRLARAGERLHDIEPLQ